MLNLIEWASRLLISRNGGARLISNQHAAEAGEAIDSRVTRLNLCDSFLDGFSFPEVDEKGSVKELGAGGSGIVFKAYQTVAESVTVPRAIKFFLYRDDIASLKKRNKSPISKEDFSAEIVNITSFNHQYLVKVISAGFHSCEEGMVPYIITDYVSGPTLRNIIENSGHNSCLEIRSQISADPEKILDVLIKLGSASSHIFERGFSHCDIAPKNVFMQVVGGEIQPILGDLGISKPLSDKGVVRKTVFIAGSRKWMPNKVQQFLEKEVPYSDFLSFQPYWDIYGFCSTGLAFMRSFPEAENAYWFQAVEKALLKGLQEGGYDSIDAVVNRLEFLRPVYREAARIPELSNGIGRGIRKMMPVEALRASDRLSALVRHPAIFRLSRVPQLTTANYILPGSTHTRYEHTLGALETMRRYLISLMDERDFLEYFSVEKVEVSLVSAALSNATRFPLSNIIHEMRGRDRNQFSSLSTQSSLEFIFDIKDKNGNTIYDIIQGGFKSICMNNLDRIVGKKKSEFDEADSLIYSMLHSSLDVRVVDFVRRDAHHLGIITGDTFKLEEVLEHLTVHNHKIALRSTGISVAEHIVSLRYWLFSRAYWNRPNRAYFSMCRYVLSKLSRFSLGNLLYPAVLEEDQRGVLLLLASISESQGMHDCVAIINKLIGDESEVYWTVFETNRALIGDDVIRWAESSSFDDIDDFILGIEPDFLRICSSRAPRNERVLLFDFPTEPGSNKLGNDIYVTDKRYETRPLRDVSHITQGVNDSFLNQLSRLRIYCHPSIRLSPSEKIEAEDFFRDRLMRVSYRGILEKLVESYLRS